MAFFRKERWNWHSETTDAPSIGAPIHDDPESVAWLVERYRLDPALFSQAVEMISTLQWDAHPLIPALQIMALVDEEDEFSA
jgi:hypothetical protein